MYFGGFLLRRPGSWPMWLAFRSTATAASALVAAFILRSAALPKLGGEMSGLGANLPVTTSWLAGMRGWLVIFPLPGLILGIAAMAMRSVRPVLAVFAALMSAAAVLLIVATLAASLVPMYRMPEN